MVVFLKRLLRLPSVGLSGGFTIVELLVTMTIVSSVMAIAYYAYTRLSSNISSEYASIETAMDKIVGLELLRLDVEHAGFGVAYDESNLPIQWSSSPNTLILRSTLNNSKTMTQGWLMADCVRGSLWTSCITLDERKDTTNNSIVFLNYQGNLAFSANSSTLCPINAHFIGYPVDTTISNGCINQVCTQIRYRLSSNQPLSQCALGTSNLLRQVGGGSGVPIINCVADWEVRFGLDTDGDGTFDVDAMPASLPATRQSQRSQVKYIAIYLLVQSGRYDPNFNFGNNITLSNGITLSFPLSCSKCPNYRWKVIEKKIKFMGL